MLFKFFVGPSSTSLWFRVMQTFGLTILRNNDAGSMKMHARAWKAVLVY